MPCSIDACLGDVIARGMCGKHYRHTLRHRVPHARKPGELYAEKFWESVTKRSDTQCWEWTGPRTGDGFGRCRRTLNGEIVNDAHRVSYAMRTGKKVSDTPLRQLCKNQLCVNPEHIRIGTAADAIVRRRGAPGERHGNAKLDEKSVRYIRTHYKRRVVTMKMLAAKFDLTVGAISQIIRRRKWKHLK